MAATTFCLYLPALRNDFAMWDDDRYVTENGQLKSHGLALLSWAFLESGKILWHPLTWLSHALDVALWGLNPRGHHLTSIALHAMNALLVYAVVSALVGIAPPGQPRWQTRQTVAAAVTAILFGVHPIHVESVAWVSERKNVLSMFFSLAALYAYLQYVRSRGGDDRRERTAVLYLVCLGCFILGLLSKPVVVILPAVLLVLDWHPLDRLGLREERRVAFLEKVPLLVLSIAAGLVAILSGSSFASFARPVLASPMEKLLIASRSITFYLEKLILPIGLNPLYLDPGRGVLVDSLPWISLALTLVITASQ